jgi:hypothetical protein
MTVYDWHRVSAQAEWGIVAEGESLGECAERLLAAIRDSSQHCRNRMMLVAGKHPEMVLAAHREQGRG